MSRLSRKAPRWLHLTLAVLLAVLVVAVLLPTGRQAPTVQHTAVVDAGSGRAALSEKADEFVYEELNEAQALQAPKHVSPPAHNGRPEPGIALVMDDVGYDLKALKRVLALPFPVAISVLPDAPNAAVSANMAHAAGSIVMLHLPMEPTSPKYRAKMTSAFLKVDMDEAEVRKQFDWALQQVPFVTGVNNHMGSLLTTFESSMRWVMKVCGERSLFFIDSKTSHGSVAAEMASQQGLRWGARRIFLDHTVEAEDLRLAWDAALRCAAKQNSCIVIAHPHAETLNFLEQQVAQEDYELIHPVTTTLHTGGRS